MLTQCTGNCRNQYVPDYTVFDFETTGLSTAYDAVIEISAVKVRAGEIIDEFSTLINPGREIPWGASSVNGITDEMVAFEPYMQDVLPRFMNFVGNDVLVGHNIRCFDMKFLWRDCEKYLCSIPGNDYIDTLRLAKAVVKGPENYRLTTLAEYYGISTKGAHRALQDCIMNQRVFEAIGRALETKTQSERNHSVLCPQCGSPLVLRNGRYGRFFGCSGYPACKYTERVTDG